MEKLIVTAGVSSSDINGFPSQSESLSMEEQLTGEHMLIDFFFLRELHLKRVPLFCYVWRRKR